MDCFTGLVLSPASLTISSEGTDLVTRAVDDQNQSQHWKFVGNTITHRLISNWVIDGSQLNFLDSSAPRQQWEIRPDIQSYQETANSIVPKLTTDNGALCLITSNRFDANGSLVQLFPCNAVNPGNAGWTLDPVSEIIPE